MHACVRSVEGSMTFFLIIKYAEVCKQFHDFGFVIAILQKVHCQYSARSCADFNSDTQDVRNLGALQL